MRMRQWASQAGFGPLQCHLCSLHVHVSLPSSLGLLIVVQALELMFFTNIECLHVVQRMWGTVLHCYPIKLHYSRLWRNNDLESTNLKKSVTLQAPYYVMRISETNRNPVCSKRHVPLLFALLLCWPLPLFRFSPNICHDYSAMMARSTICPKTLCTPWIHIWKQLMELG